MTFTDDEFATLRRAYWKHVPAEELLGRSAADLAGAVRSHLELAQRRPQGTARVRVSTPLAADAGWDAEGRSVVEIVTDDMPFLVDSVSQELTRTDRAIFLVVHPQLVVRRDIAGTLLGPADRGTPDLADTRESWMHLEIDRLSDAEAAVVEGDLRRVLEDVRSAVEDWQKMGEAVLRAADDLLGGAGLPDLVGDPVLTEAWDLLCWLADNQHKSSQASVSPESPTRSGRPPPPGRSPPGRTTASPIS